MFLCLFAVRLNAIAADPVQTLTLRTGWNLVSFWLPPQNPAPSVVFGPLGSRLLAVYAYDSQTKEWPRYAPQFPPNSALNTLTEIASGKGYWVHLAPPISGSAVTNLLVHGRVQPVPLRIYEPGWHLVGFHNNDTRFWADLLGVSAGSIQGLYEHHTVTNRFVGFEQPFYTEVAPAGTRGKDPLFGWVYTNETIYLSDPSDATSIANLRNIRPGAGYWLRIDDEIILGSVMELRLPSDVNVPPMDNFPGPEDEDLNGNGIFDSGFFMDEGDEGEFIANTQDTIWFRVPKGAPHPGVPILSIPMTVVNLGTDVLHFEIDSDIPWLSFTQASGSVRPGTYGILVRAEADLYDLPVGVTITNSFNVRSTDINRVIHAKITVPPLSGPHKGSISVTDVADGYAFIPDWPITIDIAPNQQSGVIVAADSTQFSSDVSLTGVAGEEDVNLEGWVDVLADDPDNVFGIAYTRHLQFEISRYIPTNQPGFQAAVVGEYRETWYGLGNNPIGVSGIISLAPYTDLTSLDSPE